MAPSTRRIGAEDSATRSALLDASRRLMLDEGYAAVTSRRVAATAGLKPQLVHYYFRTMDDLFLALFRQGAKDNLERQAQALASPHPLRALWEFSSEPAGTALMLEFIALANHRKVIRQEIASYAEQFRGAQVEAISAALAHTGFDTAAVPPVALMVLMSCVSRVLVMEQVLGVTTGHPETLALVDQFLAQYEDDRALEKQ